MKKLGLIASPFALSLLMVTPVFAAGDQLLQLISLVNTVANAAIPILIAVALVVFFWGLIVYIYKSGEGKGEGKNVMIAGLVALFIMVSVWGIIRLAQNTLLPGGNDNVINAPRVQ